MRRPPFRAALLLLFLGACAPAPVPSTVEEERTAVSAGARETAVAAPPLFDVIPSPDLSGSDRNEAGLAARPEEEGAPDVVVEVLETFRDGANVHLNVNYVNKTPLQGNKTIHVLHYDRLGRIVNVTSRVFFFRPYQQSMERITVPVASGAVRWTVRVK